MIVGATVHRRLTGGGEGRNRTADTWIFSPLLYRLSYLAVTRMGSSLVGDAGLEPATSTV